MPGCEFRHMGGHFGAQVCMGILVPRCPFGKLGMGLGMRAGILVPGHVFGQASRHFGAQEPV